MTWVLIGKDNNFTAEERQCVFRACARSQEVVIGVRQWVRRMCALPIKRGEGKLHVCWKQLASMLPLEKFCYG